MTTPASGSTDKYRTAAGKVRWRARWTLTPGPNGERRRQTRGGFTTRADAERFLRARLADLDRGLGQPSREQTVAAYLTDWLAGKRIRPTTRDNYATCITIHTIPRIGGMPLQDVTHRVLDRLYRELEAHGRAAPPDPAAGITEACRTAGITCRPLGCALERHAGLSVRSVQHVHGTLRTALQDAVRDGLLARNPADLASPPRRTSRQRRVTTQQVWSSEQARTFLDHIKGDPLEVLWTVALATGLRRAELVGLTWRDIDLAKATLEVRTTTTVVRGKPVTTDGKTDAARRRLTLDPHLVQVLTRHRDRQARAGIVVTDGPVFTDDAGAALDPQRLSRTLQRTAAEAGVPPIGVHGLRHTAATLMLTHHVPIHVVANRLGHTDASTTLAVYAHVMPDDDRIAATAIAGVLFPRPGPTAPRPSTGPDPYRSPPRRSGPSSARYDARGLGF